MKNFSAEDTIKELEKWYLYYEKKAGNYTDAQLKDKNYAKGAGNYTWFWRYLQQHGLCGNMQGQPWCQAIPVYLFAFLGGDDAPKKCLGGVTYSTIEQITLAKKAGQWVSKYGQLAVGDWAYFKHSATTGHVECVLDFNDTYIWTMGGNTSDDSYNREGNCVGKHKMLRSKSTLQGYLRPLYSGRVKTSRGMTGKHVREAQELLIKKGFSVGKSGADGDFGTDTVKAVKAAQKALGLNQSGTMNKETYNALLKLPDVGNRTQGTLFKKYNLSNAQIKGLASLCLQEQGTLKGVMFEASLMANLFEKQTKYKTLVDYVLKSGWFAKANTYYNKMNAGTQYQNAVKQVLCDGLRVLPTWVNEHDCFSDIKSVTNNGKSIAKTNRTSYKKGVTLIKNTYGSTYTFYGFADSNSDPFGATSWGKDDTHYDFDGKLIKGVTGEEVNTNKTEKKPSKIEKWEGEVMTTLNVRAGTGAENGLCSFSPLKQGVKVSVCDTLKDTKGADWYYIKYNGKYGFVSAKYIKK